MNTTRIFDVLIVYTYESAKSAADASHTSFSPFSSNPDGESYATAYAYFLDACRRAGLSAAFATSRDVIGAGLCQSYWTFISSGWVRHTDRAYSQTIFDKFSPLSSLNKTQWKRLFASPTVTPYNDPALAQLLGDKLATYRLLPSYSIPTISIRDSTRRAIVSALKLLTSRISRHPSAVDFGTEIVVKDRYGSAGNLIFKIEKDIIPTIQRILKKHSSTRFVIQPYLRFGTGFSYNHITAPTDIRLIYQNDNLVQSYLRRATAHDFRCNTHQGGTATYVASSDIPRKLHILSRQIRNIIGHKNSLFTLDFAIADSHTPYLLEGNIRPGLPWDLSSRQEARKSKELIDSIVQHLATRARAVVSDSTQRLISPPPLQDTIPLFA